MTTANQEPPRASRTTHQHLLSVILTEAAARFAPGSTVRLLDAGCGNGELLTDLYEGLRYYDAERRYEVYGFDVHDWEYGPSDLILRTAAQLSERFPDVPWKERLVSFSTNETWGYPDNHFDIIVSNQVIEHVEDAELFFSQIQRTLRGSGFSVHLFPSYHCVCEVHTLVPFVHWPRSSALRHALFAAGSRLGFGYFRSFHRQTGTTHQEFCRNNEDFLARFVHYRTTGDLLCLARRHGLRGAFGYTKEFYNAKLRERFGKPPVLRYAKRSAGDSVSAAFLRYVSSVTLFLEAEDHPA